MQDIKTMRVMDVAEVVALEQAIAAAGLPLATLMDRAGSALAQTVTAWAQNHGLVRAICPVTVLAGSGNNGGDGWVAAELLARAGFPVHLIATRAAEDIKAQPAADAAARALQAKKDERLSLTVRVVPSQDELTSLVAKARIVIDALLGTGFSGSELREPYASWITVANAAHAVSSSIPRLHLAADVPSGVSAQDGTAADPSFIADATITMLACKPGLLADSAKPFVGAVGVASLEPLPVTL